MMQAAILVLGMVAMVVLVFVAIRVNAARERERTEGLRQAGRRLDLRWHANPPRELAKLMESCNVFRSGHSRKVSNVLGGEHAGFQVIACDHRYVTGGGNHRHVHQETIAVLELPAALPAFRVLPENVFHKIGQVFGYQDIDLPEEPTFSSRYLLRGEDEAAIRRLFRREVAGFFVRHPGLSGECIGHHLLLYRPGQRVPPGELEAFLQLACDLGRLLTRP